jgi:TonB family protein
MSHSVGARRGQLVLKNRQGQVVRMFDMQNGSRLNLVYREDTRRIESCVDTRELEAKKISFQLLTQVTRSQVQKTPLQIANVGQLEWVDEAKQFSPTFELDKEESQEKFATIFKRSALAQMALVMVIVGIGHFFGESKPEATQVMVLPQAIVDKMMKEESAPPVAPQPVQKQVQRQALPEKVEPKASRLPKIVNAMEKKGHIRLAHQHARGGFKGPGPKGFGSNEANMNSIGALSALDHVSKSGRGNGGSGGLNLAAVGNGAGSGAGGKGYGGFGNNGAGGKGLGGLGTGTKQGLANAMYGKGLVAAPFGEGSPAPGVGGYGTRGQAGGGEAGAGYGRVTMVGSSKGLGPKGNGPAGSGGGGKGYGWADADSDDMDAQGGLDRDQIAEVIARHTGEITYCYEQGLQVSPSISGRVAVRFLIGPQGRVTVANVAHSSVRSSQVEGCIVRKLQAWNFPRPQGGVSVRVTYPFILRRVGQM